MRRSDGFHSRAILQHENALQLKHASSPFHFLNPTRAQFKHSGVPSPSVNEEDQNLTGPGLGNAPKTKHHGEPHLERADSIGFQWRSRDNRKGRHTLQVHQTSDPSARFLVPESTSSIGAVIRGIVRMMTQFPYWDVSWLVAVMFTLGSVIWVLNAFFVWLPLVQPSTEFPGEISVVGGWTAFVGATIFEIGSVLLMIEAINENRAGCFGWALQSVVEDLEGGEQLRILATPQSCRHHHQNRQNFVGKGKRTAGAIEGDTKAPTTDGASNASQGSTPGGIDCTERLDNDYKSADQGSWQWFPTWHDLTTHYIYELGFLACSAQMFGATIFWISGFTAIPQIAAMLTTQQALDGAYWVPQIIGGTGFIVSGTCFMLETQARWYIPAPRTLGWHIGLWNLIGALGFTLCGALGPAYLSSGAQFEASLATFWGSWAFLIGSVVQWYESLDKNPVEHVKGSRDSPLPLAADGKTGSETTDAPEGCSRPGSDSEEKKDDRPEAEHERSEPHAEDV